MIEDLSDDARASEFFGHRTIVSRSTTHIVDITLEDLMLSDIVSAEDQDAADLWVLAVLGKADEVALED